MSIQDDFDLVLVIGTALKNGQSPKEIMTKLMGRDSWFYARRLHTGRQMYIRAKGEDGYETFVEGEGWIYRRCVGMEAMTFQLLSIEWIEKFFAEQNVLILQKSLNEIVASQNEISALKKEIAGNQQTIDAAAVEAASALNGFPPI